MVFPIENWWFSRDLRKFQGGTLPSPPGKTGGLPRISNKNLALKYKRLKMLGPMGPLISCLVGTASWKPQKSYTETLVEGRFWLLQFCCSEVKPYITREVWRWYVIVIEIPNFLFVCLFVCLNQALLFFHGACVPLCVSSFNSHGIEVMIWAFPMFTETYHVKYVTWYLVTPCVTMAVLGRWKNMLIEDKWRQNWRRRADGHCNRWIEWLEKILQAVLSKLKQAYSKY